jgi:hypothetical protein
MKPEKLAAYVTPPMAGAVVGENITVLATSTASASTDLGPTTNPGLFNRFVDVVADGGKIYVVFDNDSTHAIDETTTGTTEATCWPLADGVPQSFVLDPTRHRYIHYKAASGTPTLRIRPSSPTGTGSGP